MAEKIHHYNKNPTVLEVSYYGSCVKSLGCQPVTVLSGY